MKRVVLVALLLCLAVFVSAAFAGEATFKKGDMATICKSGPGCGKFETATKDAKMCKCGAETDQLSVLKAEDDLVVLCSCGGGCVCDLNAKSAYKCACNNPVKVVRIFGK